ncbi:MAG: PepSY domain-containing protein [Gammaproteobacteria bacterium]|nr:PepSY domain-containing protein [Gammaproteobacteria bacterium]
MADLSIDEVRSLTERGEIQPLQGILAELQKVRAGHAIEVELEQEDGRLVYEVEWLDPQGKVWEILIDAVSGEQIKVKEDD